MNGTVFDIKEFSVYDGPGIRVTVFLKGCPLRCRWCHNPEGLSPRPQIMMSVASCADCGRCAVEGCTLSGGKTAISSDGICSACGKCIDKCPQNLRKIAGTVYTPKELAEKIMKYSAFFGSEGGVTFSGGEPTLQAEFLCEVMDLLPIHKAIQTCGFCETERFKSVANRSELIFFDIKHTSPEKHKLYTGVDNGGILRNLEYLKCSEKPFIVRIPLIKGVNDDADNLSSVAKLLNGSKNLLRVELLPYNTLAGAKYEMTGKMYKETFEAPKKVDISSFSKYGIECNILKSDAKIQILR